MAPTFLVVESDDEAPIGWLGEAWERAGITIDVVKAQQGAAVPARVGPDSSGHDALVVLGGRMGAYDDADHDWLAPTRALIARTVAEDVPLLGICLGHQLTAVALGGAVSVNPAGPTRGLQPVGLTDEGRADPLLGPAAGARALHYNNDIVSQIPSGATLLATTRDGAPQALRLGPRAWTVQFHPEATPEIVSRWGALEGDESTWHDVSEAAPALRQAWLPFADRFVGLVSAR